MSSLSLERLSELSFSLSHNMSHSMMVLLLALEGGGKTTGQDLTGNELTPQPQPHMRVNAESEWERRRGRERGRENLTCWEDGGGKLPSSWVYDAWARGFGGVLRKLKQTQTEERRDIRAARERERWRSGGIWVTFQGRGPKNDETTEWVGYMLHRPDPELLTTPYIIL